MRNQSEVQKRQKRLGEIYIKNPSLALIEDSSEVIGVNLHDPFRTSVSIGNELQVPLKAGIHRAVGGDHDFPNPGDILCAALAVCFESTIRMISNRLNIELIETRVKASAQVDVRGTLMIDRSVPVGFQLMHLDVLLVSHGSTEKMLNTLLRAVEHSCIIYQTIKQGIPITISPSFETK